MAASPVLSRPGVRGALVSRRAGAADIPAWATAVPGIGRTISGVTITSSSLFCLVSDLDWNSLPSTGMLESRGTLQGVLQAPVEQTADGETLPRLQLDFGLDAAGGRPGM